MVGLDDGTLILTSYRKNSVWCVQGGIKQSKDLLTHVHGTRRPLRLCVDQHTSCMYVGQRDTHGNPVLMKVQYAPRENDFTVVEDHTLRVTVHAPKALNT